MDIEVELEADESAVWALWGRYELATLRIVQQGMYEVHFASGGSRWTTVMEMALPKLKTSVPLAMGATVLLLAASYAPHSPLRRPICLLLGLPHGPERSILAAWVPKRGRSGALVPAQGTDVASFGHTGLLRVDFGGGTVRWALAEETLRPSPPSDDELVPGSFLAADTDGGGGVYARALLLGKAEDGDGFEARAAASSPRS